MRWRRVQGLEGGGCWPGSGAWWLDCAAAPCCHPDQTRHMTDDLVPAHTSSLPPNVAIHSCRRTGGMTASATSASAAGYTQHTPRAPPIFCHTCSPRTLPFLMRPQGYNDGMNAGATSVSEEGVARVLSLETAKEEGGAALPPVTAASFADALGVAGKELLDVGLKGLVQDVEGMLPYLRTMSVGSE